MNSPLDALITEVLGILQKNPMPFYILAVMLVAYPFLRSLERRLSGPRGTNLRDPRTQLKAVGQVGFRTVPLLNKTESGVWAILEDALADHPGLSLMAQISMGEILEPDPATGSDAQRDAAFRSINSKRIDMGVFDQDHRLRVAIEVQGSGHFLGNAEARDKVKREVFSRAGVPLVEVFERDKPAAIVARLEEALRPPKPPRFSRPARPVPGPRAEPPLTAKPQPLRVVDEPPLTVRQAPTRQRERR
ncbi:DUF2726 domain-containing protein [Halovulum sp. GXIMD14794]